LLDPIDRIVPRHDHPDSQGNVMNLKKFGMALSCLLGVAGWQPAAAQEAEKELNNGTNPTLLANTVTVTGKFLDVRGAGSFWVLEPTVQIPFGKKNVSLGLRAPIAQSVVDKSFDIGDVSILFTHVVSVNRQRGLAYTLEFFTNTAARPDIGFGEPVLKASGFYVNFLKDGSILAPALVQQMGFGDGVGGKSVNSTTFDLYYVPKLKDSRMFMTVDPAIVRDWRAEKIYGTVIVTVGRSIGRIGKGNFAIFTKPQIQIGADRPSSWGIEIGAKLVGF